jgi:biopolymer transport protein ExbB/TolQ
MGMLTLIFIALIVAAVLKKGVKEIGLLALAMGFLGQLIGLMGAFEGIEAMGGVSQSMLAGGLKVSSITSIYGLLIYIISLIIQVVQRFLK